MTGKWSAEQDDVSNIKMKLTQFKGNIAALKEQSPREFLELLSMKLVKELYFTKSLIKSNSSEENLVNNTMALS